MIHKVMAYPDRISVRFSRPNNRDADLLDLEPFEGLLVGPSLDGEIGLSVEADVGDDDAIVFFKCFKSNTITILVKKGDSQNKGMTLKLCALLTSLKGIVLLAKHNSVHIKSWSSEVSSEVTYFG
ncbi:hypothetical protein ACFX11_038200 [Malus domestica]